MLRVDSINIQIKKNKVSVNIRIVSVIGCIKVKKNDSIVLIKSYVPFGIRKVHLKITFVLLDENETSR